ncbi:MAG: flagellar hook-basal body complex protein [Lachnospiraceae bacterium]|nr:flagellar hook-basal body complex protein [Lachnospiraceae bacterium]
MKDIRTATVDRSSTPMTATAYNALSDAAKAGYMEDPSSPGTYYQKKYNVVPGQYSLQLADITDSEGVSILDKGLGDGTKYSFAELGITFGAATYEDNPRNLNEDPAMTDLDQAIILKFNDTTGAYEGMYTNVSFNETNQSYEANAGATLYSQTTNRENYMNTLLTFNAEQALATDEDAANAGNARKNELIASMGTDPSAEISRRFIEFNFSAVTNNNTDGRATIKTAKGNINSGATGRKVGTLSGIQVAMDGKITASYTNGQTRLMGQIAAAQFANASGLEKQGENLYASTMNSGDAVVMDVSEDGGKMSTGVLEMSNVDLSNEFTSMITAQRGFQANSRIITVSDTLLEELTNLKR